MRYPKDFEIETELMLPVVIKGQILPERSAPFCMNHDSPAFSDSGDPAEIISWHVYYNGIDITGDLSLSDEQEIEELIYLK